MILRVLRRIIKQIAIPLLMLARISDLKAETTRLGNAVIMASNSVVCRKFKGRQNELEKDTSRVRIADGYASFDWL